MEIEEANKSLWRVRDWLDANLGLKDLKAALEANGSVPFLYMLKAILLWNLFTESSSLHILFFFAYLSLSLIDSKVIVTRVKSEGGKDTLVARLADGVVFGRATCSTCPNNNECQMQFREGLYHCTAQLQWGACGYKGTDVVIHKWKNPPELLQVFNSR